MMKRKLISDRCYLLSQSWYFERVIAYASPTRSFKLKVDIRRNAYDNQSHARVCQWDGTKWQIVVDAPIAECECKKISYVSPNVKSLDFEADSIRLLKEALQIVGE